MSEFRKIWELEDYQIDVDSLIETDEVFSQKLERCLNINFANQLKPLAYGLQKYMDHVSVMDTGIGSFLNPCVVVPWTEEADPEYCDRLLILNSNITNDQCDSD